MYNNSSFGHNYNEGMIDRLLGKAYLTVKEVHDQLDVIKKTANINEDLKVTAAVVEELTETLKPFSNRAGTFIGHDLGEVGVEDDPNATIGENFLSTLTKSHEQIREVGDNIDTVKLLAYHINELKAIAAALTELLTVQSAVDNIETLNENAEDIKNVSAHTSEIISLNESISDIRTLSENIEAFPRILDCASDLAKVAKYITSLVVCANNINVYLEANGKLKDAQEVLENDSIPVVAENAESVNTVATNMVAVNTVADNIADIKKVTNLSGFEDVSTINTSLSDLSTRVETLEAKPDVDLSNLATKADISTLKGPGSIIAGTTDITSLNRRLTTLEETATSSESFDLSDYATKAELADYATTSQLNTISSTALNTNKTVNKITGNATITAGVNDIPGLTSRIEDLEENQGSSTGNGSVDVSDLDLSAYAKKTDVNAVIGDTTIKAGTNDIAGLTSRVASLESNSSSGSENSSSSSGSDSSSSGIDMCGWFPLFNTTPDTRCTGIRHEISTAENYSWIALEDCWVVVEGKGGTASGKDCSLYCAVSHGVEAMFAGSGSNNGDNVYCYGHCFMPKGSRLSVTMNGLTWVYFAHTAVYKDVYARPEEDTPT